MNLPFYRSVLFVFICLFLQSQLAIAQSLQSYKKAAEKALLIDDYNAALLYLNQALLIEPADHSLQ